MRFRPSGNAGLLMVHINTFEHYQNQDAWTWEHQALVRTRVIFGSEMLKQRFSEIKRQVLSQKRDRISLLEDVVEMRDKMRKHLDKSSTSLIDIKQGHGGLVDIEFLVQYLVLRFTHEYPQLSEHSDNISLLTLLSAISVINETEQACLITNYCKLRDFGHHATLQNSEQMISIESFAKDYRKILPIIEKILQ
jgi:glutamate-ammonia-ligase adenylyltransferase